MSSVDVVIPNYQYGRYLRECVVSVLDQGIDDLRVLIIDNASTDDSVEVARQLAHEDPRVEVLARRKNLGPHASFNEGIDWARSDYFTVLCSDDYLTPGSLGRSVAIMEKRPEVGLAYGDAWQLVDHEPAPPSFPGSFSAAWTIEPGDKVLRRFCRSAFCPIFECTTLARTAVQKRVGYYRRELLHTDDLELWMRFAKLAEFARTDAVQGVVRMHPQALSAAGRGNYALALGYVEAAFDSFFAREDAGLATHGRLQRLARRGLAGRAYWSAISHFCRGEHHEGRALIRYARRLRPLTAVVPPIGSLLSRDDVRHRLAWLLLQMRHAAVQRRS